MYIEGGNYYLTKHGRQRYLHRVGEATDREMLIHAIKGDNLFQFVWKPTRKFLRGVYYPRGALVVIGYRLVTVLKGKL